MTTGDIIQVILAGSSLADRQWIVELLRSGSPWRFEFTEADTGEAALQQAQGLAPGSAPILLACALADMDAMRLIRRLIDPQGLTPCPVVVVTPGNGRDLGPVLLRAGAQDYIGEEWLSPYVLARAVDNARVRWAMERGLSEQEDARQQAEEQLRQAQRLTQTIIDGAGALVFAKDLAGRYFLTNRAWRERAGLSEQQADGVTDEAVYGPLVAQDVRRSDEQVLTSGRLVVAEETTFERGQAVYYLSSKFPLLDDTGHPYAVCGVSTDVTSLKQTQAALQARERELQTLADNTPDILARFDRQMRHVFVSAAIERMTGRPPQEFIGRTARELGMPADLCDCWENAIQAAFQEACAQTVAFTYEVAGEPGHFSGRFVPEFGSEGAIDHVLAVLHDDTEQKRAEQDISRLLEEERHYARLLARMAQASRLVHASLSADEIAQVLTHQAREILGARRAITQLTLEGPGARNIQAVSLAADANPTEPPHGTVLTASLTGKSGEPLGQVQLTGGPYGDFTHEDRTVLMQLAAIASTGLENARLYASLREADHRKDEFLATLAHELRNPLAPIRNGLEILRRSGQLTGPAARARDMMERQLAHMVRLVDDLLDVSRISRGKVDLRLIRLTLQSVLESALESSRPAIEASRHRLVMQLPTESVWIDGDLTRLAQVVSNLLNNAAKYTPAGGRIELSAQVDGPYAVICVTDNGTGISTDMLPRVFDLFAQVDHTLARAQGGLGIGLSLVKKLVELHGGDIRAESRGLGQGSRFTVRLPLAAGTTADDGAVPTSPTSRSAPSDAPCRVLVCDDNIDGAESLALMLGLLGHEVRTVHDGPAALATVRNWRPDAVLLDIGLPGMSGYEVARQMRSDPQLRGLLLVAVTGWGTQDDQRRSAAAGFDQHLTKPVEATALESLLASRLARAAPPAAG